MKKIIAFILLACIIIVFAGMFTSCKTRQVANQNSTTSKSSVIKEESAAKSKDSVKTIDNTVKTLETNTEAKNASKSDIEILADSIKTTTHQGGETTTTFYTNGKPTKIRNESTGNNVIKTVEQTNNSINTTAVKTSDSTGKKEISTKQDSTGKTHNSNAKGSGTTWATIVPIVGGIVLIVALILVFIYFKKR